MKISEFGGEFALIKHLTDKGVIPEALRKRIVKGIGDDCAVLRFSDSPSACGKGESESLDDERLLLVTTDMLVDGDHFNRQWATPEQIGWKAMEANVSDIAAMGGRPLFAFISLALTDDIPVEFMDGLYTGMQRSCAAHGLIIAGGDTTHGKTFVINVAILGEVRRKDLCLRGDAKSGDLICVTGDLGKSWAGLELYFKGLQTKGNVSPFLEPRCRMDVAELIAPHANAMIDVSDGLASEVRHICEESGCGAVVWKDRIPMAAHTRETGELLGKDPYHWALSGGEDFELVFTISKENLDAIAKDVDFTVVGRILPKEDGIWLQETEVHEATVPENCTTESAAQQEMIGDRIPLPGGYDHFSEK